MKKSVKKSVQPSKGKSQTQHVVKISKTEVAVPAAIQQFFKPVQPKMKSLADGAIRMSGADLIDFIPLVADATGSILRTIPMNPQSAVFGNTRLGVESLRFEKYRFTKLCFHFLAELPTSQKGSLIMAYDPDASDVLDGVPTSSAQSLQAIQILMAYRDAVNFNIWLGASLDCKVKADPQKFYYTNYSGGDIRLAQQGQLFIGLGGSTGLSLNTTIGKIALEWEIELFEPTLEALTTQYRATRSGPSLPVSAAPGQGFNVFNSTATVVDKTENAPVFHQESTGSYFDLAPGIYELWNTVRNTTAPSPFGTTYFLEPLIDGALTAITKKFEIGSIGANFGLSSALFELNVPQGGAKLFSTLFPGATNLDDMRIKLNRILSGTVA